MKFLDILRTASANMKRSKLRTFLTIIAIFIGALTLSLTNGIGAGVSAYIDKQLGNVGAEDVLVIQPEQELEGGSSDGPQKYNPDVTTATAAGGFSMQVLSDKDISVIREQKGILSVEPMLSAGAEYITAGDDKYQVQTSPHVEGTRLDMASGSVFAKGATEREVIIPISFVDALGFKNNQEAVGKVVRFGVKTPDGTIEEVTATIKGVQQQSLIGFGGLAVTRSLTSAMRDIQTRGLPEIARNQYGAAVARFDVNSSKEDLQKIKDELKEKGYNAMTIEDTIGVIKQVINAATAVLNFFAAIALLAASFGIINTLLMAVQERTKEIGLMKAMGMGSKKIFLLFSTEAVLLGFWGSLLGILAANGIGRVVNSVAAKSFLKDLPGFNLMSFPAGSMLTIMLIIMTVAFIAGTLPARRAAKQNPIDALRYE